MHAYLILGYQKSKRDALAAEICIQLGIDRIDSAVSFFEKTIGIEEVRGIQRQLIFKPLKSKQKAVIIPVDSGITIEAQNALLKTLEEPPANTVVILTAPTIESVLPTIISRCFIKETSEAPRFSQTELNGAGEILSRLPTMKIGEKLRLAQDVAKDKETALVWLGTFILAAKNTLIERIQEGKNDASQLKTHYQTVCSLQSSYKTITSTNASVRLVIENLLISL